MRIFVAVATVLSLLLSAPGPLAALSVAVPLAAERPVLAAAPVTLTLPSPTFSFAVSAVSPVTTSAPDSDGSALRLVFDSGATPASRSASWNSNGVEGALVGAAVLVTATLGLARRFRSADQRAVRLHRRFGAEEKRLDGRVRAASDVELPAAWAARMDLASAKAAAVDLVKSRLSVRDSEHFDKRLGELDRENVAKARAMRSADALKNMRFQGPGTLQQRVFAGKLALVLASFIPVIGAMPISAVGFGILGRDMPPEARRYAALHLLGLSVILGALALSLNNLSLMSPTGFAALTGFLNYRKSLLPQYPPIGRARGDSR